MTLKTRLLAAAAALALPAIAVAQPPAPTPPVNGTAMAPIRPSATPPAPPSTTPPTQQPQDATETQAQQPENMPTAAEPQTAQTPPPATTPAAATQPAPAAGAQAQAAPAATGAGRAATAADLRAGVQVRDQQGGIVGTIESADAASAVVFTGAARGRLALTSFGSNGQGLVIAMTKAQLEAAVAAARPS
jgi:hypothetical protein